MPRAVVAANIRKRAADMYPMTFSERYFERKTPPATAIPVALAWAAMAPVATA